MSTELRGALIVRTREQAQIALDRMAGVLGVPITTARQWAILTPRSMVGARGTKLPNRVLVYDLTPEEIPQEIWETLIPSCSFDPDFDGTLNVFYFAKTRHPPKEIDDHVFTSTTKFPTKQHACAFRYSGGRVCGKKHYEHVTVPIAQGARR